MARIKLQSGVTAGGTARAATHYGARHANEGGATKYQVSQNVQKLEIKFDYTQVNADVVKHNADKLYQGLPAGAVVKSAYLVIHTAFDSPGTSQVQPKLVNFEGIAPDSDGLHASASQKASLVAGAVIEADGAQVNGSKIPVDLFLDVNSSVTNWTSGEASYVIEYEVYDYL